MHPCAARILTLLSLSAIVACGDSAGTGGTGGSTSTSPSGGAGSHQGGGGAASFGGGGAGAGAPAGGGGSSSDGGAGGGTGGAGGAGVGGEGGGDACATTCFGTASWDIDNLSPCFFTTTDTNGNMTTVAISTSANGQCPADADPPTEPWSTNNLNAACPGTYELCVTLKAGDWHNQDPSDCTMETVCTSGSYDVANVAQDMPALPGWLSDPSAAACVQQFITDGGYALFTASGTAACGDIADADLGFVYYCPLGCNDPNPPPNCATCML